MTANDQEFLGNKKLLFPAEVCEDTALKPDVIY